MIPFISSFPDPLVCHRGLDDHVRNYSRTPLIRTLVIHIGLPLRVNLSRIPQDLSYLVITSYRIEYQYSVVASGTLNQEWSNYPDFLRIRMAHRPN